MANNNNIQIILKNNDCLKEIEKLPDNSIDCVMTDPPYFINILDDKWSSKKLDKKYQPNSHIRHLPVAMKFDKKQVEKLCNYYTTLSKLLFKKMKPGGYFISFSSPRLYHAIAMGCELGGFEIRDMINWIYTKSMPKGMGVSHIIKKMKISDNEKQRLTEEYKDYKTPMIRSCNEPICVAMKPITTTFIQNEINFKTGLINFSHKVGIDQDKVPSNVMTDEKFNETYDKNFLVSKPTKVEKKDFNTHITVKPIKIMEQLLKVFTKPNSLILDPFMGSGTTGIACKNLERNFYGIELNQEYYKIAEKRINN